MCEIQLENSLSTAKESFLYQVVVIFCWLVLFVLHLPFRRGNTAIFGCKTTGTGNDIYKRLSFHKEEFE